MRLRSRAGTWTVRPASLSKAVNVCSRCLVIVNLLGVGRGRQDRSSQGTGHGVPVYQMVLFLFAKVLLS